MAFYSDAAQAALDEYQGRVVSVAMRLVRNSRPSSSGNIVIALGESFESVQASIIRFASQENPSTPTQFSLSVAWQDDPPPDVKVAKISKNFLGDFTNLTYVNGQNLGELLCLIKRRGEKDTLLVTLNDQALGCGPMSRTSSDNRRDQRSHQSSLGLHTNREEEQAVNPSALIGGMIATHARSLAEAKREYMTDSSPRRRQGGSGWVEEDQTRPWDPHDRSTKFSFSMPNKAKPETDKGDQRSENTRDEDLSQIRDKETRPSKPGSAAKKPSKCPSPADQDKNIHESRRHLFGPRR